MAEFKEFPKRLYPAGPTGASVLVLNAEEEAAALGDAKATTRPAVKASSSTPAAPVPAPAYARKALIAAAKAKGVKKPTFLSNDALIEALGDDYPHLTDKQEAALDRDGDMKPGGAPKGGNKPSA